MASKGYMIWTCDRALPEETIEYIQNTIGRRKLYGAVLNDTNTTTPNDAKATYNCAEDWKKDWKKYRNEWEKILMDGSRSLQPAFLATIQNLTFGKAPWSDDL
uniref:Uncharacterized protein n=2 Tax=Talaromyces marneffei PM1 TaxID=1077442 RepID=A0A093VY68_TALMA